MMRFLVIAFTVAFSLAAASTADAAGGCGWGWHRGPYGGCLRNGGPVVVVAPAPRAVVVVPQGPVVVGPGRVCPWGYHLGPYGHCRLN
jgi:hypothetical protein